MKNEAQIAQFEKTVNNLKEVLEKLKTAGPDHAVFRDSAIQRFEIAFDVCWKTLKEKLRQEYGIEAISPKKVFQESFKQTLIENDDIWISMTDMRNETAHAYNERFAEKVLLELPKIQTALEQLLWKLKK
ncbi:MAG: HI0074 family nucleotidyltransferase substrate-binding subunit [Patescibacteria group bacterium]